MNYDLVHDTRRMMNSWKCWERIVLGAVPLEVYL